VHLRELTINSYIQDSLRALGARNRVDAVVLAARQGWLEADVRGEQRSVG
jgi:DNA-binding NarL/FixJ family response regulator